MLIPAIIVGISLSFVHWMIGLPVLGFSLYLVWFFRDPRREIVVDDKIIFAAADGKVLFLEVNDTTIKIGIRMSPFSVHINRAPISGRVGEIIHKPGSHRSVYFTGAEAHNERNLIEIENEQIICEILQITGIFARRIECWVETANQVVQGEKIGMIRFGSQTNVMIKLKQTEKAIKPLIKTGDAVKAGLSAIAEITQRD
ncbi:MAG: phosphatidylserine decarboxylase [Candidatus Kariarchaeaceae archaeon]|jgi:phosphatidylserine decarboxylase